MKRTKWTVTMKRRVKTGPKREFTKEILKDVENLVGMYGARNKELALYFDVAENSIDYWIKHYKDFEKAVKRGRVIVGLKVAKALVAKALGYSHPETHIMPNTIKIFNTDGKVIETRTEPLMIPIIKHYPPDAYAAHKYLTIMYRDVWSENNTLNVNHNHQGTVNYKKIDELVLNELTTEQKDLIFQINMKQLKDVGHN